MSYVPSRIGVQANALAGLKSRTTWKVPPCGAVLNWYTGFAPTSAAVAVQVSRSPTRGESSLEASETVPDGRLRSSRASTRSRGVVGRRGVRRTGATDGRDFKDVSNERNHMVVSFAVVVCDGMT